MVIIPILCGFEPIVLVFNENCVATLLIGNLPIPENGSYLEISKISAYPPLQNGMRGIELQIFNLTQIDKISKNQADCHLVFEKIMLSLM